jgi:aminoglycoside phosphotransferase (APT) family kinase protein
VTGRTTARDDLAALVQELAPGGRLVRSRRLRGGVGARMHVLDIERADATRFKVSLRRFPRDNRSSSPEHVAHEYKVLQLVEKADIPAPRPLLLDAEGRLFGVPAIVLTYLPGAPLYFPRDVSSWVDQLAQALLGIHAVTPERFDLSFLSVHLRDGIREELARRREYAEKHSPLAREVHAVLIDEIDRIEWPEPCFVHDDFWPGNTVWLRGRLTGVVDWTHAELGDPRTDVAQCRIDLALILDSDAADAFRDAYQARASRPLPDLWYFDLFRGLRALLSYQHWLAGYHDARLAHVTLSHARERIEAFLRAALDARVGAGRQRLQ